MENSMQAAVSARVRHLTQGSSTEHFAHCVDVEMSAATNYSYLFPGEAGNGNKDSAGDAAIAFTIKDLSCKHTYIFIQAYCGGYNFLSFALG